MRGEETGGSDDDAGYFGVVLLDVVEMKDRKWRYMTKGIRIKALLLVARSWLCSLRIVGRNMLNSSRKKRLA